MSDQVVQDPFGPPAEGATPSADAIIDETVTLEGAQRKNDALNAPEAPAEEQAEKKQEDQRFWQSKFDKAQVELKKVQDALEQYRVYDPILRAVTQNPQVLAQLSGGQTQSGLDAAAGGVQSGPVDSPKKPQKPRKPANYDPADIHDTDSDSYRYMVEMMDYNEQMADWQDYVSDRREADIQRAVAEQENAVRRQNMVQQLQLQYEMSPDQVQEFIRVMDDPGSYTLDNLVKLYRVMSAPDPEEARLRQKALELQQKQQKLDVPTPAAAVSGVNEARDDQKAVQDAVVEWYNKTNPFN